MAGTTGTVALGAAQVPDEGGWGQRPSFWAVSGTQLSAGLTVSTEVLEEVGTVPGRVLSQV